MILIALAVVAFVIVSNMKKEEREKYYTAAGNIIKEDYLNYSLQNPLMLSSDVSKPNGQKMMVFLKTLNVKPKKEFVFDPEKRIFIGRNKENNNIFIDEATVSQNQCCIYSDGINVYLQDSNSANGTIVKSGLFSKQNVCQNCSIQINNNDVITIGSNKFKIILFYYDMVTM